MNSFLGTGILFNLCGIVLLAVRHVKVASKDSEQQNHRKGEQPLRRHHRIRRKEALPALRIIYLSMDDSSPRQSFCTAGWGEAPGLASRTNNREGLPFQRTCKSVAV